MQSRFRPCREGNGPAAARQVVDLSAFGRTNREAFAALLEPDTAQAAPGGADLAAGVTAQLEPRQAPR